MKTRFLSLLVVCTLVVCALAPVATAEVVELSFWHCMGGAKGEAVQRLVDDFNASQDAVHVTAVYQSSYNDVRTKLSAAAQSGNAADLPDVVQMEAINTSFMADADYVINIQKYVDAKGYDTSKLIDVAVSTYSQNGEMIGLPFNCSAPILWYNADLFEQAGITEIPVTYEDIIKTAKILVEKTGVRYGFAQALNGWFFESNLYSMGYYYGNNENGRVAPMTAVDDGFVEGFTRVFQTWYDVVNSGYCGNFGSTTSDTIAAFQAGQVAMFPETPGIIADLYASCDFKIGTANFPLIEANENGGTLIGGGGLYMIDTQDQAKLDASWDFIEYAISPETQSTWVKNTGYVAVTTGVYDVDSFKALIEQDPNYATALKELTAVPVNNVTLGANSSVVQEARAYVNEAMEKVYEGAFTAQEGAKWVADQINASLSH